MPGLIFENTSTADEMKQTLHLVQQKLQKSPRDPVSYNALGVILGAGGAPDKALRAFDQALALCPTYAEALMNKGLALESLGSDAAAFEAFSHAAALTPSYTEAEENAQRLAAQLGRSMPASPWRVTLKERLGTLLKGRAPLPDGMDEAALRARLTHKPGDAEAALRLAVGLKKDNRLIEAEHFFRHALRRDRSHQRAAIALAELLDATYRLSEAIELLARFQNAPAQEDRLLPLLLRLKADACDWRDYNTLRAAAADSLRQSPGSIEPFAALSLWDDPEIQRAASRALVARISRGIAPRVHARPASKRDKITIGYISADFRQHAVSTLLAPLFEMHDRRRFRVFGYSLWGDDGSALQRRVTSAFDKMESLWQVPSAEAAARIAADEVDILADLTGYTRNGRPEILAHQPAPIQVNLGHAASMGAPFIHYYIGDAVVTPPYLDDWYDEKIVRLPFAHQINDLKRPRPRARPRRDYGLPEDGVVFCSFNTASKFTPELFDTWMGILARVPGSVLWLRSWHKDTTDNLLRRAAEQGVDPTRLVFAGFGSYEDHLGRYGAVDIALDTLRLGGHTTTSDALWMGCPVVNMPGKTMSSRGAGSLVRAVGVPELSVSSLADYEALAVDLATSPEKLHDLKTRLERARRDSPLFNPAQTVRQYEWAYERMWETYVAGGAPQVIEVPAEV